MMDLRPVGYVVGLFVLAIGALMLPPAFIDGVSGDPGWRAFAVSFILTALVGGALTLGCQSGRQERLQVDQALLLVVSAWVAVPLFGALPFMLGETGEPMINAIFEAVSGLTTTGSTVMQRLETLPAGLLLWRALLQWIGGIGIVVFAIAFLPGLRIGGMQLFRSEGFDAEGSSLGKARDIAASVFSIYLALTLAAALVYGACGMDAFDAVCHAFTTIATGGFANHDGSFAIFTPSAQYACVGFMILASLPFLRYLDLVRGDGEKLLADPQIRAFLCIAAAVWIALLLDRLAADPRDSEIVFRETLFNSVSILTGTGYATTNYAAWGAFAVTVFFVIGLIGGCAGSTCCSVKVFRYQILGAVAFAELQRVRRPNGIFAPRFGGKRVSADVVTSVVVFFFVFVASLAVIAVALAATGLDLETSISGAATALANVGPGLGETIGPVGDFRSLSWEAKAILIFAMLLGRLELLSVLVLATPGFWRR
ncbi:MAG: TrkH family potassium uptake protein [Pseudomonadota bacterium]